jgi:hypothetical protein
VGRIEMNMHERKSEANPQTLDPEIWVDQYGDYLYRIEFSVDAMHEDFDEKGEWKVEKMPPDSDGNGAVAIDEMGAIFDKIEQTIGKLEKECPVHWESEKAELDQMICDIRERWSEVSEMSPDDFDG